MRVTLRSRALGLALGLAPGLVGCGGSSSKLLGEECLGSSECAAGLVCDFGVTPPVCAETLTRFDAAPDAPPADAAVDAMPGAPDARPDAAVPDAAVPDAAVPDAAVPDATV